MNTKMPHVLDMFVNIEFELIIKKTFSGRMEDIKSLLVIRRSLTSLRKILLKRL